MDIIFMNSINSKTSELYRLVLNLSDKIDLKRGDNYVALSNRSICYTWKNIKNSYEYTKRGTWNKKLELPDRLFSVTDVQDYFKYIIKRKRKSNQ